MIECIANIDEIIKICPHYENITNYDYDYDDNITLDLIYWYKELIFSSNLDNPFIKSLLNRLDYCIYKYITDFYYQSKLINYIKNNNIKVLINNSNEVINIIFTITYEYDEEELYNIDKGKWLIK